MYLRTTTKTYKGKTYTNYVLVESVATPKGPRQRVICSLGALAPGPREEWLRRGGQHGGSATPRERGGGSRPRGHGGHARGGAGACGPSGVAAAGARGHPAGGGAVRA